jgi:hypothetical protein
MACRTKIWSRYKIHLKISLRYVIFTENTFRHLRKISENDCWLRQVCPFVHLSVRQRGTTRVPLDEFSWNLFFEFFSKISREHSGFIKMWQEWGVFYMKIYILLWKNLTEFVLEWEKFQTKLVKKIKIHVLYSITFFPKIVLFYEIMWNNIVKPRQATDYNIIRRMRIACWITKVTDTHSAYEILIIFPRLH